MRKLALFTSLVLMLVALASPASATRPDEGSGLEEGHKITICHATRSLSNPYVKIQIDIAAWDIADPDSNDHGPGHHAREKNGIEWADYALADPSDDCVIDTPPPGPVCEWTSTEVTYVITFNVTKLYYGGATTTTKSVQIDAGTYDVVLISSDFDRGSPGGGAPYVQPNERWLLQGTSPSGYSNDLVDGTTDIFNQVTTGLSVTFGQNVSSITAEHWSVGHSGDTNPNSVVPQAACLTRVDR